MIIGIDASRANKQNRTGTEWYSYHLITKFAQIDSQNQFVLYTKDKLLPDLQNLPSNFKNKILRWPPQKLWTQCRFSMEMIHPKIDVLFVPAHTIPIIHPINTVTTCHDIGFERFPELYSRKEIVYHRFSMKLAFKHAKKIITISNFSKQEMLDVYNTKEDKITVIPNSYDSENYKYIEDREVVNKVTQKYVPNETPYIFYVGRLESKKNTANLVKAFGILKNSSEYKIPHKLLLAGSPGTGYEKVEQVLEEIGDFKNDVIMPGWVDQLDLAYLMNGASVFAFPSLYEGFGIPVLEAFACHTPVAAANAGSIPEIAGEGALLFDPQSPEDIADKIYTLFANKDCLIAKLKLKGLSQCQKYTWDECARRTLNCLIN